MRNITPKESVDAGMGPRAATGLCHVRIDPTAECVWVGRAKLRLPPRAYEVLRYLASRPGRLVTKRELLDELWDGQHVTVGVLKTHLTQLRRLLGDNARAPRFIETVYREGYRFIAPIAPVAVGPAHDLQATDTPPRKTPPGGAHPARPRVRLCENDSASSLLFEALGRLGKEELRILEAASVAGTTFRPSTVAAALGMDRVLVGDALLQLTRRSRLFEANHAGFESVFSFKHAWQKQSIYDRIHPARLASLHLAIGNEKERRIAELGADAHLELARHFEKGGRIEKALQYYETAGDEATTGQ